jgi:hypothetical protein
MSTPVSRRPTGIFHRYPQGHFASAADELKLSPAYVGKRIKTLQATLGTPFPLRFPTPTATERFQPIVLAF